MNKRIFLGTAAFVFIAVATSLAHAEESEPKLIVRTDRPGALYRAGEVIRFAVELRPHPELARKGQVTYLLRQNDLIELKRGELSNGDGPMVVETSLQEPGFVRCDVTYVPADGKKLTSAAAAGVDVEQIRAAIPAPDDFDEFWRSQRARLEGEPMEPVLTPVDSPNPATECFDLQINCPGGAPVSGYYVRPRDAKARSQPAILSLHGAGVRSSRLNTAMRGALLGAIALDINAHGLPNGREDAWYEHLRQTELKGYALRGAGHRETTYFNGMFLRLMRAMDFLMAQEQWDGRVLVAHGSSQGGGQAIAASGLEPRVTFIAASVPAMCDHNGYLVGRFPGWPRLVTGGAGGKVDPAVAEVAKYYDAVNFAMRSKADVIMSVGFIDRGCPPAGVYAAFNCFSGRKEMIIEPLMGHEYPSRIEERFYDAIAAHLRERAPAP